MAKQSPALLGTFFADHPGPATREACVAALVDRYRISEARAHEWLDHALDTGTLHVVKTGISPRDLAPVEAVAHVLASHPAGLAWPEIARHIAAQGLCPTAVKRAPRKDARVVRSDHGVFRHVRFGSEPVVSETPPAFIAPVRPERAKPVRRRAASVPRVAAAAPPEPPRAREMPIVRRRRETPAVATPEEPESARVVRSIAAAISGSTRAIELQALREHMKVASAIELSTDKLRSVLVTHASELGWHIRGPFVSGRHIPWADLDEALASAARGRRRDPAELVARVRRLLRITNTTARSIHEKLQRACGG